MERSERLGAAEQPASRLEAEWVLVRAIPLARSRAGVGLAEPIELPSEAKQAPLCLNFLRARSRRLDRYCQPASSHSLGLSWMFSTSPRKRESVGHFPEAV